MGKNRHLYERGKKIRTWEHVIQWVMIERRRIFLLQKRGGWNHHSFDVIAKMNMKTVKRLMNKGVLFEAHKTIN